MIPDLVLCPSKGNLNFFLNSRSLLWLIIAGGKLKSFLSHLYLKHIQPHASGLRSRIISTSIIYYNLSHLGEGGITASFAFVDMPFLIHLILVNQHPHVCCIYLPCSFTACQSLVIRKLAINLKRPSCWVTPLTIYGFPKGLHFTKVLKYQHWPHQACPAFSCRYCSSGTC